MNDAFYQLDETKQQTIVNAALKEFTINGFEKASTNKIVKEARIGKGTLFYYFTNKKELYLFLVEHCLEMIQKELFSQMDVTVNDYIERWKQVSLIKLQFLRKYPSAMSFLARAAVQDEHLLDDALKQKMIHLQKIGQEKLQKNIDASLFRDDLDQERAMKLIDWVFVGYEKEMRSKLEQLDMREEVDFKPFFADFFAFLDVLKRAFYTKEERT